MHSKETVEYIEKKAKNLRRNVVYSIGVGHAGHLGGSMSIADVVAALYFYKMRLDPKDMKDPKRDRFILSKGHAALIQYAALTELGLYSVDDLKTTKALHSVFQGHPDYKKTYGLEAGTGSLGQGLSIGLGMAIGQRLQGYDSRVYVVIGDGEQGEGQIWEAAMGAAKHGADNLVAILDRNHLQATGPIQEVFNVPNLAERWRAFGWNVTEIDGHDVAQILDALDAADQHSGKPTIIIAETIKGKGVSFAENQASFHNAALTEEQYKQALTELA